jgi:hypothetical protein
MILSISYEQLGGTEKPAGRIHQKKESGDEHAASTRRIRL